MSTQLKKYRTAFKDMAAENKELAEKNEQLTEQSKESVLRKLGQAQLERDFDEAMATLSRIPQEEWVRFKDESGEIVPAIVSEELWDAANVILRRRSEDVKNRQGICNHANLLTGKL